MSDDKTPRDLLDWLGITDAPRWWVARPLGPLFAMVLALLLVLALVSAFAVLLHTVAMAQSGANEGINLGAGALIVALLGAPFLIWSTVLKHQTLRYQKEGHITDRINKAVEQLGAEKTVKKAMKSTDGSLILEKDGKPQTIELTEPNIEVRIGAILSLERIAQDSTRYDRGRDHVRVMEILSAYVRENAKCQDPVKAPAQFGDRQDGSTWAHSLEPIRHDLQIALTVLGRRSAEQLEIELAHRTPAGHYRLDLSNCNLQAASLPDCNFSHANLRNTHLDGARAQGANFRHANLLNVSAVGIYAGGADFRCANLGADLRSSVLDKAKFQFVEDGRRSSSFNGRRANFGEAQLIDCTFEFTRDTLEEISWNIFANFEQTNLRGSVFIGLNRHHEHQWPRRFPLSDAARIGVAFQRCDLTVNMVSRFDIIRCFADASTSLPENTPWPTHWPRIVLSDTAFKSEFEKWRADPENYTPPA